MKKYMIFALSLIILFIIFQVLSGLLLTLVYRPDIEEAWNMSANLPQEAMITGTYTPFFLSLLITLIAASIAYFIPNKVIKNNT